MWFSEVTERLCWLWLGLALRREGEGRGGDGRVRCWSAYWWGMQRVPRTRWAKNKIWLSVGTLPLQEQMGLSGGRVHTLMCKHHTHTHTDTEQHRYTEYHNYGLRAQQSMPCGGSCADAGWHSYAHVPYWPRCREKPSYWSGSVCPSSFIQLHMQLPALPLLIYSSVAHWIECWISTVLFLQQVFVN